MPLIGMPIVISLNADAVVQTAANDLAHYLERMSGAAFTVQTGDGSSGIVLGLPQDFSGIPFPQTFGTGAFERDDYRMVSTANSLYLLGATPLAVQHATWDLLDHFGYRRFLPPTLWEIVPETQDLSIDIDEYISPSYFNRSGPRSVGVAWDFMDWLGDSWVKWTAANRIESSVKVDASHEYENIIARNQDAFDLHPEYYPSINGVRSPGAQFCIGNPAVQELVIEDAIQRILSNPDVDSISMEPSDNPHHCDDTCEFCSELGSVTDRVILLCNLVANALELQFEKTYYVSTYAYSAHAAPPSINAHPKVIVSIANAWLPAGYTLETLLSAWSEKVEILGLREYYAATDWNGNMPGEARAQLPEYLKNVIVNSYNDGVRFMDAENNGAWGPHGLGYYLSSRMLWDVTASNRMSELIDDFLTKSFGPAKEQMALFYGVFDNPSLPKSEYITGLLFSHLEDARALTEELTILQRIDGLILYTRFVELKRELKTADFSEKQDAFDNLLSFVWRTRETMMVDTYGEIIYLHNNYNDYWDTSGDLYFIAGKYKVDENVPFSETKILNILKEGVENNQLAYMDPIDFQNLVHVADANDNEGVELGLKFRLDDDAVATGIAFHKGEINTGTHVGNLWSDTGDLLATGTFTNETATGLQQMQFDTPIPLTTNTTYVASYYSPNGTYSFTGNFFTKEYKNGPLVAIGASYKYGEASTFPDETWKQTTYWVTPLIKDKVTQSLWSQVPNSQHTAEPYSVELGLQFHSDEAAALTGLKFYKEEANTGVHTGNLWSEEGTLLATVTFTDETATGWQQALFDTPIPIAADTTYVASYHAPNGGYSFTTDFFAEPYTNGPLTATGSVFKYGDGGIFPDETWQETNYWVSPIVDFA